MKNEEMRLDNRIIILLLLFSSSGLIKDAKSG